RAHARGGTYRRDRNPRSLWPCGSGPRRSPYLVAAPEGPGTEASAEPPRAPRDIGSVSGVWRTRGRRRTILLEVRHRVARRPASTLCTARPAASLSKPTRFGTVP